MGKKFDESTATPQELWDYCILEYQSANPVVKKLINSYYECIREIVSGLNSADRVLEVGCGAAESSSRIISMLKGQHFEASDYDGRYVQMIKEKRPEIKARQESVYELQRADDEFGCVFLLEVLEHLDDYRKALSEIFRVSNKYVVISVPKEPLWRMLNMLRFKYLGSFGNTPGHINHWSVRSFRKLLSEYGEVVKIYEPAPWQIALVKKKN